MTVRVRVSKVCTWVFFLTSTLCVRSASGLALDAQRIGVGGVFLGYHSDAIQCNPAYLALPTEKTPLSIPVPLGLLQLVNNFPVLDPDDPDFDPIYITNLLLNPPIHLQLITPDYTATEAHVNIAISEDYLQINLGELQTFVPTEPVDSGIYDFRSPRVGMKFGRYAFRVAPFRDGEAIIALSDNLSAASAESEALERHATYAV